jgi:hypothetical protein
LRTLKCTVQTDYSNQIVKNVLQPNNNKQKYLCKECRRQFVLNPEKHKITDAEKPLIDQLFLEHISLPKEYQEKAISFIDLWKYYQTAFPKDHHIVVGK